MNLQQQNHRLEELFGLLETEKNGILRANFIKQVSYVLANYDGLKEDFDRHYARLQKEERR
jgi:hypothetical protein